MLGRFDEAKKNVEQAKAAADRNPGNAGIRDGYLGMRARLISDTGQWEKLSLTVPAAPAGGDHANMPGMPGMGGGSGSATWTYIVGVSAAKIGDLATAEAAESALKALTAAAQGGPTSYAAKPHVIREKELGAIDPLGEGAEGRGAAAGEGGRRRREDDGGAVWPARPDQAGLRAVRRDAARGRTRQGSRAGLRAVAAAHAEAHAVGAGPGPRRGGRRGSGDRAGSAYQELASMPGAAPASPAVQEAQKALKTTNNF